LNNPTFPKKKKLVVGEDIWVLKYDPEPNTKVPSSIVERSRKSRMKLKI
jgi:hypothetical protein